ncbi:retrovirus-related pol polyprotein from transposon TNT 1-94 [Tanacetum coccineum]
MACDVSWKSQLSSLSDENVLLKTQVKSVVQERENIKLEFQKLFNSIKATRDQNQRDVNELIEHVNQNTYTYGDVRAQNQDLLMTIYELKKKLRTLEKGKNVNTKFDKSKTLGMPIGVESSKSVRRSKSKDNNSKNRVLKNTKSSSVYVWKKSSSTSLDSNKHQTKYLDACQKNTCVSDSKNCVARNPLTRKSSVKRALFTTPLATKSKNLGATSIVAKSRLSVVNSLKATNKVSSASPLSSNSSQSDPACPLGAVHFGNDHFTAITGYGDYVQGNLIIYHNLEGDDLLIGSQDSNLYTISISEMAASSPTWVYFLRTKDEAPDMIIDFVNQVQMNPKAQILTIRTDNVTEFKNEKLREFYAKLGIVHKTSIARTPQQNGVVECRNHTLVEAARTMLIFSKAPEFLRA